MRLVLVSVLLNIFVFMQKTAYDMRISDWSSDVCSSDRAGSSLIPKTRSKSGWTSGCSSLVLYGRYLSSRGDDRGGLHLAYHGRRSRCRAQSSSPDNSARA